MPILYTCGHCVTVVYRGCPYIKPSASSLAATHIYIVVGGLIGEQRGSVELWWRERLPLQDVTDARLGACLREGEDWAHGGDGDIGDYDARGARLDGGVLSDAGAKGVGS